MGLKACAEKLELTQCGQDPRGDGLDVPLDLEKTANDGIEVIALRDLADQTAEGFGLSAIYGDGPLEAAIGLSAAI